MKCITSLCIFRDPTRYESAVVDFKWPTYSEKEPYHLLLNVKTEMKKHLSLRGYNFWDNIYQKYYWTPKAPVPPQPVPVLQDPEATKNQPKEEQKAEDNKKIETKSTETKTTEYKATETKATESKATETKAEMKPTNTKTAQERKSPVPQNQQNNNPGQKIQPENPKT